jgi:hypothetical protein
MLNGPLPVQLSVLPELMLIWKVVLPGAQVAVNSDPPHGS